MLFATCTCLKSKLFQTIQLFSSPHLPLCSPWRGSLTQEYRTISNYFRTRANNIAAYPVDDTAEARTPDSDPRFLGSPANNMQAIYCSSVARRAAAQRLLSRGYPSARSQLFRFTICFVVLRDGVFACLAQVPLLPSELAP